MGDKTYWFQSFDICSLFNYVKNGYAGAFVNTPGIWSFLIIIIIIMQGDQFGNLIIDVTSIEAWARSI